MASNTNPAPALASQAAQRGGADQGIIGIQHGHVAGAELSRRLQCGMGGAQPFVLHHHGVRGGGGGERRHVRPGHDHRPLEHSGAGCEQMVQHRPPAQGVERLGEGGPHPRSQAGGEQDGGGFHAHRGSVAAIPVSKHTQTTMITDGDNAVAHRLLKHCLTTSSARSVLP
jgi:hypothetical protein